MKRTITTCLSILSLSVFGQTIIPEVFTPPLTGFNRIQDENPYILMERSTNETGTDWLPYNRLIRIKSPLLQKVIEDRTSRWENDVWIDQSLETDSIITEADQTTLKTDFNYLYYNYPNLNFEYKTKHSFTNDENKRPIMILTQVANPPTSNNYVNSTKLTIQYNSSGQRIKDSYQSYNPSGMSYTYYFYNTENKLIADYSTKQNGDSIAKSLYTYTSSNAISSINKYSYDQDLGEWLPAAADTFEYNANGEISKLTKYNVSSNDGSNPTFRPSSIDEYQYTATGKLAEILTSNWVNSNQSWKLSDKRTFTYVNEKPTLGYFYRSLDGVTINSTPVFRFSFAPLTSNNEFTKNLDHVSTFPNPANQTLTINLGHDKTATVTVYDMKGQLILSENIIVSGTLNTDNLPNGLYLLKLQSENEQIHRKIVIQH